MHLRQRSEPAGPPNGYISKTAFSVSRVSEPDLEFAAEDSISWGGSVEVFPDEAGGDTRKTYIQAIGKGLPSAVE